jgi:hypothetical protein
VLPGLLIGVGPFADCKRSRALLGGYGPLASSVDHYSVASGPSAMCSITILLKISLAQMFSNPM